MATCNGADYLAVQLADLSRQSRLPSELVVSDDCSDDDTIAIIEEFALAAPFPVHVHRNASRLGYRENFVRCAGRCSSDIIAFCDQDDRWRHDKLAHLARLFERSDVLLVHHNAEVVDADEALLRPLLPKTQLSNVAPALELPPWDSPLGFTQAFRRELTEYDALWEASEDHSAPGETMAHDQWYYFLASSLGCVAYTSETLAQYRQHDANTFGWRRSRGQSLQERIARSASEGGKSIARRASSAFGRAAALDFIAEHSVGDTSLRAQGAAKAYRQLGELCARRASLYTTRGFKHRLRILSALIREGAYRGGGGWKFGKGALLLDLTVGLSALHPRGNCSGSPSPLTSASSRQIRS